MDFLAIALDDHLRKQAKQDIKRKLSACFVLPVVKGHYTLSTASLDRAQLPPEVIKKLPPSDTNLPMTLLGRLTVSIAWRRQEIGEYIQITKNQLQSPPTSTLQSLTVISNNPLPPILSKKLTQPPLENAREPSSNLEQTFIKHSSPPPAIPSI